MKKQAKTFVIAILVIASMMLAACASAVEEPAVVEDAAATAEAEIAELEAALAEAEAAAADAADAAADAEEASAEELAAAEAALAEAETELAAAEAALAEAEAAAVEEPAEEEAEEVSSEIIRDIDVQIDTSRPNTSTSDERYPFIRYAQTFVPTELGPEKYFDSGKWIGSTSYFETLFDQVGVGEYVGRLAKDWTWEDDTHLTIELYDYIYDTDGNHLTASDVVFCYDNLVASGFARSWNFVDSYEADGDYTVKFTFTKPLDLKAFKDIFVDPWMATEKAYNDHDKMVNDPVGTGPYKVTDYVTGAYIVFEATDNYWQKPELTTPLAQANVQKVQIDYIPDHSIQMVALEDGTSAYTRLTGPDLERFMEGGDLEGKFNLYKYYSSDVFSVVPNQSPDSMMNDINMRLAAFYAIDTDGIVTALGEALFVPATVDASPATADYQSDWDTWESYQTEYDLDKVNEYLEKAGYNGETVKIICEEHPTKKQIAQLVQGQLQAAGINSEIQVYAHALMPDYLADPAGWDLYMGSGQAASYVVNKLYGGYSKTRGNVEGYPVNFLEDETFQNMLDTCSTTEGYSVDCTEELLKYILDNAIAYAVTYSTEISAYDPAFAAYKYKWGANKIVITACDYYLD